jgi:hypothetical protein
MRCDCVGEELAEQEQRTSVASEKAFHPTGTILACRAGCCGRTAGEIFLALGLAGYLRVGGGGAGAGSYRNPE